MGRLWGVYHIKLSSLVARKAAGACTSTRRAQAPNLSAARTFALAASSSRFFGGAFVSSEWRRRAEIAATSSIAAKNSASFAFDGLLKPVIFLTNSTDAP